jgi:hypothetical protein
VKKERESSLAVSWRDSNAGCFILIFGVGDVLVVFIAAV